MKILNLKDIQSISGGDFDVAMDLDTTASAVGATQSQTMANALSALLTSNPFNIAAYVNALATAGSVSSADISEINITNIH